MTTRIGSALCALVFAGASTMAVADDAGKQLYMENCASCHGATGVGDGDMAEFMSVHVPDLTTIAQRNDGVFPTLEIAHIIDGRTGVRLRGHGSEMPIWGMEFTDAPSMEGDLSGIYAARGRVLSVVYYLESLQK
ncbi:c-type cytochrome [Marimonas lutisalis]|uniref:c-type cytochrome n=1 Tax=Marimonas lutisalis TaxID=2545756 RepID=UPI0010F7D202|nr:c-type cytochrome [Marimonas lutisalis]